MYVYAYYTNKNGLNSVRTTALKGKHALLITVTKRLSYVATTAAHEHEIYC